MSVNRLRVLNAVRTTGRVFYSTLEKSGPCAKDIVTQLPLSFINAGNSGITLWASVNEDLALYPGGFTLANLEPGESYTAPWAGFLSGMWQQGVDGLSYNTKGFAGNATDILNVFAVFRPTRKGAPEGNRLTVVRQNMEGQSIVVTTEAIHASGPLVPNCFALRLLNQGVNTVMVGDVSLPAGQQFDLRAEVGYKITSPLKLVFDDGTSGLEVVDNLRLYRELPTYTQATINDIILAPVASSGNLEE